MESTATDEILHELREVKDRIAREFGNNLDAIFARLRARQAESERMVVDLSCETEASSSGELATSGRVHQ